MAEMNNNNNNTPRANQTNPKINEDIIDGLIGDVIGRDKESVTKDEITSTIENILSKYNLRTDMSFVEKIAKLKFANNKGEEVSIAELPNELQDAAFLPVNTIADIALRQDLDLIVSQLPEWFTALQVTRDAICEADTVNGKLSRTIKFDRSNLSDDEKDSLIEKIEDVEDRLKLHHIIKNHVVFNTELYGESYVYTIPYAKVFSDLYKYKLNKKDKRNSESVANMFETSSRMNGYGYGESVELSLNKATQIIQEAHDAPYKKKHQTIMEGGWITEAEIMDVVPMYHAKPMSDAPEQSTQEKKMIKEYDQQVEAFMKEIGDNISYIDKDIALPVIEDSPHDLKLAYDLKYSKKHPEYVTNTKAVFEAVINDTNDTVQDFEKEFGNVKGCYIRILPATKLIPIRIDRTIIGYYYIADQTRPEKSGERRNSGLSGYTLRTPSIGYDTFSPDQMFCEKLATKIINNFDLKFMRDNTALHAQIVAILQSHKFNEAMMRFIFIPAEHVCPFIVNEDGLGHGHSMLEPGLITARMYMFLKLYSILYQINNSQVRVYNLRMSGIDTNYKQFVQDTMRKFAARRVTANDIFNYRTSMNKVSGGSELIMPLGAGDNPPINVDTIEAAQAPINTDLMDQMKTEAVNCTPVPALLLTNGGVSEIEFAKETELANTKFNSFVSGQKLELNPYITDFYRRIMRWETDIDPELIKTLEFSFRMPTAKYLNVTTEKIQNMSAFIDFILPIWLSPEERKEGKDGEDNMSPTARMFKKKVLAEYMPEVDIELFDRLSDEARDEANQYRLEKEADPAKNILNNAPEGEDMMGGMM